jgi:hypothetical protein
MSKEAPLFATRPLIFSAISLLVLLQGCAVIPLEDDSSVVVEPEPVPELTLNIPDHSLGGCACEATDEITLFDRGISALVDGDHIEAVKYFQRYRHLESSAASDWEADIAIAYDSMLSQSPFYDPQAAGKSYQKLKKKKPQEAKVHEQALLMRDALATFVAMSKQVDGLRKDKAKLSVSLKKREEALRRLRELALGQKGALP